MRNLAVRLARLQAARAKALLRPIPTDARAFEAALLAGEFGPDDIDRTDSEQTGLLFGFAVRALVENIPEHQAYLAALAAPGA